MPEKANQQTIELMGEKRGDSNAGKPHFGPRADMINTQPPGLPQAVFEV